jgi:hypothetical protein
MHQLPESPDRMYIQYANSKTPSPERSQIHCEGRGETAATGSELFESGAGSVDIV